MPDTIVVQTALDPTAIASITAAVVTLTQLVKWLGVKDKRGPLAVLVFSLAGVALWGYSKGNFATTQLFDYFAGWILVSTSAAGVYGFTRSGPESITSTSSPPAGAGASVTVKP